MSALYPEFGHYVLPGHTDEPAAAIGEARHAERLGLGSPWVSARFDVKEAGALCGAIAATTEDIWIGTAATNVDTRHPLLTASLATTLWRLSHGRFALGVGHGVAIRAQMMGLPPVTDRTLREFAGLMRSLWRGERVFGHESSLGSFPYLHQADGMNEPIPLLFTAFGRKSLEFAGSVFDGVILHTFLSDEAVRLAVSLVRRGAERAGRDPAPVKVWSVLAVACDASEERRLKLLTARMATYLQAPGYGELLFAINGWDPAGLAAFRDHAAVRAIPGAIDSVATTDQLRAIRDAIREEWLPCADGGPKECARRIVDQFDAGADGVILHGSRPEEFEPVVAAYGGMRAGGRFAGRIGRPG